MENTKYIHVNKTTFILGGVAAYVIFAAALILTGGTGSYEARASTAGVPVVSARNELVQAYVARYPRILEDYERTSRVVDPCRKTGDQAYDCTHETGKIKFYEHAKHGIEWKTAYDSLKTVQEKILHIAHEQEFKDTAYLLALASCESRFDPKAKNTRGNLPETSIDRGLYQFNSHWFKRVPDACAYDIRCATEATIKELKAGRHHLWACDDVIRRNGLLKKYTNELTQR